MESPATEAELLAFLDKHKISHSTSYHAPVFTVEEAQTVREGMPGGHSKNLFVRDKKKNFALVVAEETTKIDLKELAGKIGLGRLSFASADRLKTYLGVTPGSVTPFALLNAATRRDASHPDIKLVIDTALIENATVHFHPLHNGATTAVSPDGLMAFVRACGFEPQLLAL